MLKYIVFSGFIFLVGFTHSQVKQLKKPLTIEDAELGFSKGLYPKIFETFSGSKAKTNIPIYKATASGLNRLC
jgi:hypothetical protein